MRFNSQSNHKLHMVPDLWWFDLMIFPLYDDVRAIRVL